MSLPNWLNSLALSLTAAGLVAGCSSQAKEAAPVGPVEVSSIPFATATAAGLETAQTRAAELHDAVLELQKQIAEGSLMGAREAYYEARAPYEELQVLRYAFPELDQAIDGRAYEYPGGELSDDFIGFHRIEIFLFARENTKSALPYANRLIEDVEALQEVLADRAVFNAADCFEGMISRLDEVASRIITSEEETWSEQTLLVIRHAWIGVHAHYRHYSFAVREQDVVLAERLDRTYRKAIELLRTEFAVGQTEAAPYSVIDASRRREIADASLRFRMHIAKAAEILDFGAN